MHGAEAVDGDALWLGGDERCGAAVAPQQEGEKLGEVARILEMQRAELEIHDQDSCLRIGADDVARKFQRVDRGIAAHEADDGALDRAGEAAALHEFEIEARRGEAGAAGYEQVREAFASAAEFEPLDGGRGESRSLVIEQPHTRRGRGELAPDIKGVGVELSRVVLGRRRQEGIAAFDAGVLGHAPEDGALTTIVRKQRFGKANESRVHIVWRHGGRDAVDIGRSHDGGLNFTILPKKHARHTRYSVEQDGGTVAGSRCRQKNRGGPSITSWAWCSRSPWPGPRPARRSRAKFPRRGARRSTIPCFRCLSLRP